MWHSSGRKELGIQKSLKYTLKQETAIFFGIFKHFNASNTRRKRFYARVSQHNTTLHFLKSGYSTMKMQQLTNTNDYLRTLKPKPADCVLQESLLSKFRHLQDQVRELNGLLRQEKVHSKMRKNLIMDLQQELRSATRQTETQRALKENSIHREKETKRRMERLIKTNTTEVAVSAKNLFLLEKKYETKPKQSTEQNTQISALYTNGPYLTRTLTHFYCFREPQAKTKNSGTPRFP